MCSADVDTSSCFNPEDMAMKLDRIHSMLEGLVNRQKCADDRISMLEDDAQQQRQRQSDIVTDVSGTSVRCEFETPQRDVRKRARVNTPVIEEARRYVPKTLCMILFIILTYERTMCHVAF